MGFYKKELWDVRHGSSFSCGLESIRTSRNRFSIKFYSVLIVFLVFDIEVSLIFPFLARWLSGR